MSYGYIRFLLATPLSETFNLFLDQQLIHKKWCFSDFTPYQSFPYGQHLLQIKTKKHNTLFYEKKINIKPHGCYTYVLSYHPKKQTLYLFHLEDLKKPFNPHHSFIRFAHFGIDYYALDFATHQGRLLFKHKAYSTLTHYSPIEPETYDFHTAPLLEELPPLSLPKHKIKLGRQYTIYLIGNGTSAYPYTLLPSIDGPCFLHLEG